jgi:hypothetical protein
MQHDAGDAGVHTPLVGPTWFETTVAAPDPAVRVFAIRGVAGRSAAGAHVVLVGHSMGADAAIKIATEIARLNHP